MFPSSCGRGATRPAARSHRPRISNQKKKVVHNYSATIKFNNLKSKNKVEMDVVDLLPAVERLEENIDDLEEALQKLLGSSLEETSRKLPLLDRAKLHVLVTYTLESLLHCMS
jgi:transposase